MATMASGSGGTFGPLPAKEHAMTFSNLRPVELAAATLVSIVILLVAIAPSLVAAGPAAPPGLHAAGSAGLECRLSPEWRLV
jgi:hypothetical protein